MHFSLRRDNLSEKKKERVDKDLKAAKAGKQMK